MAKANKAGEDLNDCGVRHDMKGGYHHSEKAEIFRLAVFVALSDSEKNEPGHLENAVNLVEDRVIGSLQSLIDRSLEFEEKIPPGTIAIFGKKTCLLQTMRLQAPGRLARKIAFHLFKEIFSLSFKIPFLVDIKIESERDSLLKLVSFNVNNTGA